MNKANNKSIVTLIVVALVALGIGFYGGVQYQLSKSGNTKMAGNVQGGFPGGSGQPRTGKTGGSQPVSGEITAVDSSSVTVKTQDGSSKIVLFSSSTKVNKTSEGSKSDLVKGEQVMVIGTTSTDGTVTAQSISVGGLTSQNMPSGEQPPQGN
jgi:hypothetical protein